MSWQLSTARTEVLDDGRRRRYCRIILAGCCSQPPPHRPMWSPFGPSVFRLRSVLQFSSHIWSCVRATSRPQTDDRTGLPVGLRPSADPAIVIITTATAARLSGVDASRAALSAPITVNINGIDARNGQAYHGRKTIAANGTRTTGLGSRTGEEHPMFRELRRRFTSRVRPRVGAASRARVLPVGDEAAIANDSVR